MGSLVASAGDTEHEHVTGGPFRDSRQVARRVIYDRTGGAVAQHGAAYHGGRRDCRDIGGMSRAASAYKNGQNGCSGRRGTMFHDVPPVLGHMLTLGSVILSVSDRSTIDIFSCCRFAAELTAPEVVSRAAVDC
jgi:hypothetical protein